MLQTTGESSPMYKAKRKILRQTSLVIIELDLYGWFAEREFNESFLALAEFKIPAEFLPTDYRVADKNLAKILHSGRKFSRWALLSKRGSFLEPTDFAKSRNFCEYVFCLTPRVKIVSRRRLLQYLPLKSLRKRIARENVFKSFLRPA